MAGQASGGQTLTPTRNVNAPAGVGGDKWGANGGDIVAVGVARPVASTLSTAETANNYQPTGAAQRPSLGEKISNSSLDAHTLDTAIGSGGNNQG